MSQPHTWLFVLTPPTLVSHPCREPLCCNSRPHSLATEDQTRPSCLSLQPKSRLRRLHRSGRRTLLDSISATSPAPPLGWVS